jgi:hypothetical protein
VSIALGQNKGVTLMALENDVTKFMMQSAALQLQFHANAWMVAAEGMLKMAENEHGDFRAAAFHLGRFAKEVSNGYAAQASRVKQESQ